MILEKKLRGHCLPFEIWGDDSWKKILGDPPLLFEIKGNDSLKDLRDTACSCH